MDFHFLFRVFRPITCAFLLVFLGGCVYPNDPGNVGKSAGWYRKTNPEMFFKSERDRGLIYFIGIHDFSKSNGKSVIPGISMQDLVFTKDRTWFTAFGDPQFTYAYTDFAGRYNPLVLRYLKVHKP